MSPHPVVVHSRSPSTTRVSYFPQPESIVLPDGPVDEEAAELLTDLFQRHGHTEIDHDGDRDKTRRPWWKTPSPWWLLGMVPFTALAMSATIAPRIEIYTLLACQAYKPDIFKQEYRPLTLENVSWSLADIDAGFGHITAPEHANPVYITLHSSLEDSNQEDDSKGNTCASDPVVQAAVAKLATAMTACMGILSCLTTGWWGSFSDRYGRRSVMGISVVGLLLTDFNFIFVTLGTRYAPGGYWFLLLGPLIEGSLGGMTSAVAAMHAYIADTTTESNRAHTFSLSLGLLFAGMALGPMVGGLLIRFTSQTLSVFYLATSVHIVYACIVWFILPESLSRSSMAQSKIQYHADLVDAAQHRRLNPALFVHFKRLFTFLTPLSIFMPAFGEGDDVRNPLKTVKRDWSLTLLAASYGFTVAVMGSYSFKFQYAASAFGWTSEELGYWLSLIGLSRAAFLTLVLPLLIKLLKPKPVVASAPPIPPRGDVVGHTSTSAIGPESDSSVDDESQPLLSPPPSGPSHTKGLHNMTFDLALARFSLVVDVISYTLMGLSPTAFAFSLFGVTLSLGTGFNPAVQSVALAMYMRRGGTESGRLFGALSVVQAMCSQILGPALFGLVYIKTVATLPRTIFFVSVGFAVMSLLLLSFVRLTPPTKGETLNDVDQAGLEESGPGEGAFEGGDTSTIRTRRLPPPIIKVTPSSV